ncbi:MAG TPA: response regulator [Dehalococcoidia bacterium]|nr:response regulator [Dehalococcoidia bacterium]
MESEKIEVLLIEDNPGDARLIQEMLTEAGEAWFRVEYADRLSRGLEHLKNGGVDVVLLDLSLPDGQGLDAFEKVQAQVPAVPVVVLTGFDDETLAVEAIRHGAQDYLVKGDVDSKVLYRAVRYSVERKRAVEDAKRYSKRVEALYAVAQAVSHSLNMDGALNNALDRVYEAMEEIRRCSGNQLDPQLVEAFLQAINEDNRKG